MGARNEVRKGQLYRSRSKVGQPWRYVKITGGSRGNQPRAAWKEVTRAGNKKRNGEFPNGRSWLQWRDEKWQMPEAYDLVTTPT